MADKNGGESIMSNEEMEKTGDEAVTEVESDTIAQHDSTTDKDEGESSVKEYKRTIDILLKATANAPIIKKKKWAVPRERRIGSISLFLRKYLKLEDDERLFLYINQTFAPAPDQTVSNLYDCYGSDGQLIIHYCKSQAWG